MKIINQTVNILTPLDGDAILKHVERCGRVCYQSTHRIDDGSAPRFARGVIRRGHESVLEHYSLTVSFITDRAIANQVVRHRIASYSQESTRYCNYMTDRFEGEITVIAPDYLKPGTNGWVKWENACKAAEYAYFDLLDFGCTPEEARDVLPHCLKTELVMTANLREWRHFFKLRTEEHAHPRMRKLAGMLLEQLRAAIPVVFDDIKMEDDNDDQG